MARKSLAKMLSAGCISNPISLPKAFTASVYEYVLTSWAAEGENDAALCDSWSRAEFGLRGSEVESFRGCFGGRGDSSDSTLFLFARVRWGALALASWNNKGASTQDRFKIPTLTTSASCLWQTERFWNITSASVMDSY
ncbi:hypothetical protein PMIN02_013151 [Paraphaeosphaeria minitans]